MSSKSEYNPKQGWKKPGFKNLNSEGRSAMRAGRKETENKQEALREKRRDEKTAAKADRTAAAAKEPAE